MKKKLNILFLVPSFPSVSETFIVNQITDLLDKGHQVTIFSTAKNNVPLHNSIIQYNLVNKTIYADFPSTPLKRIKSFIKIVFSSKASFFFKFLKTLNVFKYGLSTITLSTFYKVSWLSKTDDNFDVIHAHFGFMSKYYFIAKDVGFFRNSKLVTTFHGYDIAPSDKIQNSKNYYRLFNSNSVITVNTEYTKQLILSINPKTKNINILPVGLNTASFLPIKKSNDKIRVIFCGRLIPFKAPSLLADICNDLVNKKHIRNIEFIIIGKSDDGGEEYNKMIKKINQYNLDKYFCFKGALPQQNVITEMQNSDIFILPGITDTNGRAENQGLVIQEAQSMELPVIVSSAGGMKYGLTPNKTGFIVEEKNISEFSSKLEILINDPEKRKEFGKNGRKFVQDNYDSKVLGEQLIRLYNS